MIDINRIMRYNQPELKARVKSYISNVKKINKQTITVCNYDKTATVLIWDSGIVHYSISHYVGKWGRNTNTFAPQYYNGHNFNNQHIVKIIIYQWQR